jgi:hypothetical protein
MYQNLSVLEFSLYPRSIEADQTKSSKIKKKRNTVPDPPESLLASLMEDAHKFPNHLHS